MEGLGGGVGRRGGGARGERSGDGIWEGISER